MVRPEAYRSVALVQQTGGGRDAVVVVGVVVGGRRGGAATDVVGEGTDGFCDRAASTGGETTRVEGPEWRHRRGIGAPSPSINYRWCYNTCTQARALPTNQWHSNTSSSTLVAVGIFDDGRRGGRSGSRSGGGDQRRWRRRWKRLISRSFGSALRCTRSGAWNTARTAIPSFRLLRDLHGQCNE